MRADRRGIALIIVVLALAGVFALVMQLALVSRSAQVESRVLIDRLRDERDARAAAVIVLAGLGATAPSDPSRGGAGGDGTGPIGEEGEDGVELPEIVRALLREAGKLDEVEGGAEEITEEQAEARRRARPSPGVGDGSAARVRFRSLKDVGLPIDPVRVVVGERAYEVRLRDAIGGLNINEADEPRVRRYLELMGVEPERAARLGEQIVRWRDPESGPLPGSAEMEHYRASGIVPRDGEFEALEELLYLPDMDAALFELIRDDLCLTGESAHAGSASEAVLLSIDGVTEPMVRSIVEARREFRLTGRELERIIPGTRSELRDALRAEPVNLIEITVRRVSPPGPVYRGLTALGDRGVAAMGLKLD